MRVVEALSSGSLIRHTKQLVSVTGHFYQIGEYFFAANLIPYVTAQSSDQHGAEQETVETNKVGRQLELLLLLANGGSKELFSL